MNNWKLILIGALLALLAFLTIRLFIPKAGATFQIDLCHNIQGNQFSVPNGYYSSEGNCFPKTHVCTDESALNYDSHVSSHEMSDNSVCEYKEEPTITPEPTEPPCTQDCGNPPTFAGSSTEAPSVPMCVTPIDAPKLQGYGRVTPSSVEVSWWPSTDGADKQFVVYGYSEDNLQFATVDNEVGKNDSSYIVHELEPNKMAFFQVWAVKGGCVSKSGIIDP